MGIKDASEKYELHIDLSVLDHLGINLYSNVPAVMTELVANSWDADAHSVSIAVDLENDLIEVLDDGHGMSAADINQKFLTVGFRRRDTDADGGTTIGGRPVMGRKGVGKLAPFSIASQVEVYSSNGGDRCGLRMTIEGIRQAKQERRAYHPEELDESDMIPSRGTRIVMRQLKRERVRRTNLRQRLARRFSVIGSDEFKVTVDGENVTSRDRGDLSVLQYLWTIGAWTRPAWCDVLRESATLKDREDGWDSRWVVNGWLGTCRRPKDLENAAGNLNGIVVLARGRLFQENILGEINDGRHFTKYLTGQIEVDFLDDSTEPDIATSDRQRVIEDDPRYIAVLTYLKSRLNELEAMWSTWRTEDDPAEVKSAYPQVAEWLNGLAPGYQKHAERMIGVIERMPVTKAQREDVLKHAIFGFERLKLTGMADQLVGALEHGGADQLVRLFADQESIEATLYRDIVKGRLATIRVLREAVDRDAKEKVLQQILFDRLWLLDPSWERASGTEEIEKQFKSIFPPSKVPPTKADDQKDSSHGRFDIAYQTVAGKHVIVELKRASRKVGLYELTEQGAMYVDELERLLIKHGKVKSGERATIEVVFVLGDPLEEQTAKYDRYINGMASIREGSRVCTYEQLITQALEQYREYLDRTKDVDRLSKLLDNLGTPA